MAILVKKIFVKAYNSISKIKKYYVLLKRTFNIIKFKSSINITLNNILQLAVKVVNNTIKLNGLVLILLIFKTYFKITKTLLLFLVIYKKIKIIKKIIYKIKKIYI